MLLSYSPLCCFLSFAHCVMGSGMVLKLLSLSSTSLILCSLPTISCRRKDKQPMLTNHSSCCLHDHGMSLTTTRHVLPFLRSHASVMIWPMAFLLLPCQILMQKQDSYFHHHFLLLHAYISSMLSSITLIILSAY